MRKTNRLAVIILSMLVVISATLSLSTVAKAEGSNPYKGTSYTVKFVIADKQFNFDTDWRNAISPQEIADKANISDGSVITVSGLEYGTQFEFNPYTATNLSSNKYVVKEIHRSGSKDKASNTITVTQDETYVIAYAVGTIVDYTVDFVGPGLPSQDTVTYHGIIGQKDFYIPYKYIEGFMLDKSQGGYEYVDNNIRVTEPLQGGEHFVFTYKAGEVTYIPGSTNTVYSESTNTVYSTEVGAPEYTYQVIPGQTEPRNGGVTNNRVSGGTNQNAGDAAGAENGVAEISEPDVPLGINDIVDIEDDDVPLAGETEDTDRLLDSYVRCLFIVALTGIIVVLITVIGTVKINYDKKKRN
ncbi:MAG: hypothetical protein IKW81_12750 [Pseudobutyrivibrio sp.]|nr:hypothetical protein [Pseudobutyrivibrio sp.]